MNIDELSKESKIFKFNNISNLMFEKQYIIGFSVVTTDNHDRIYLFTLLAGKTSEMQLNYRKDQGDLSGVQKRDKDAEMLTKYFKEL